MPKRKLIYRDADYVNFNDGVIRPLVELHYDMVEFDPAVSYDRTDFVVSTFQQDFLIDPWYRPLEDAGHSIVIDHLWDSDVECGSFLLHNTKLDLRCKNWVWYHTALLADQNGYSQYLPKIDYTHDFLCLMNKIRDHRDAVASDLAPQLAHARWSYVDRGRLIQDDQERATPVFWEFYMNPQWYNSTCWSLVVESYMRSDWYFASPGGKSYQTEISEKSYKPLADWHPMIVCGSVNTLKFLHAQGFETFDNLWSEAYDAVPSDQARQQAVFDLVRDVVKTHNRQSQGWDKLTQQKLAHNKARFFDLEYIKKQFAEEIINDIEEFLS